MDGHYLFENASLLADLLAPHPDVRILLSTSWVQVFGYQQTVTMLPQVLRTRVIGSCFDPARHGPGYSQVARGYQVLEEVRRRGLTRWVALDDDARGWPEEIADRLILTNPVLGIAGPCREQLERWLTETVPSAGR
ncbi:hypothetical protein EZ216_07350 [Ramlibacter humi]|uniref:Uncharacterized protein n=1 Tax=Ramlibacter humi TaxID=2530451 RepID=A0A4Z0CED6_9BURK|nr:hypothetical protein EZ216_07350 [Ramlibacter humi]